MYQGNCIYAHRMIYIMNVITMYKKRCNTMFSWINYYIYICMKHICKVIYDLAVDFVIFDLGLPLKVKSRSQIFQGADSHKWCIIWSKFYEIHIVSHIWPFSVPYNIWPLIKLKGQIKVIGFSAGLYFISSGHSLLETHIGSHVWTISLPQHIWPWIIKVTWLSKGCLNGESYQMLHETHI